jgi:hypothetical protein
LAFAVWCLSAAPGRADRIEYSVAKFDDNAQNEVASTSFSLLKTLFERTRLMLDIELDQTTVPPLAFDGVTGASRPARQSKSAFLKNRGQFIAGVQRDLFSATEVSADLYFSQEVDYRSLSAVAGVSQGFAQNNFTVALTGQYTVDSVGEITSDGSLLNRGKEIHKGNLQITQLLSPQSYVRLGLDGERDHGFLSDPYRTVEIGGDTVRENVPSLRFRTAAWLEYSKYLASVAASWSAEYRYAWDDWGLKAHEAWFKLNKYVTPDWILSAQYRYAIQGGIDFGEYGRASPGTYFAPGDYKLRDGEFHLVGIGSTLYLRAFCRRHPDWDFLRRSSVGLKYGRYFNNDPQEDYFSSNLFEARLRFDF